MRKILTAVIIFFSICLFLLLQGNLFSAIKLFGTSANVGIIFVGSVGLICGPVIGGVVGTTYGILFDSIFGRMLGLYTGLYLLMGVISGMLNKSFSKESKASWEMLISILTICFEIISYAILMVIRGFDFELKEMIFTIVKETIFNVIIVLILFKPLRWFGEMINKGKNSYYLL